MIKEKLVKEFEGFKNILWMTEDVEIKMVSIMNKLDEKRDSEFVEYKSYSSAVAFMLKTIYDLQLKYVTSWWSLKGFLQDLEESEIIEIDKNTFKSSDDEYTLKKDLYGNWSLEIK